MTSRDLFTRRLALPSPAPDIEQAPPIELVAVLIVNRRGKLGRRLGATFARRLTRQQADAVELMRTLRYIKSD